jgi:hypothetical protein
VVSGVSFKINGSLAKTQTRLKNLSKLDIQGILNSCGQAGVDALSSATPQDTGLAAGSWGFQTQAKNGVYTIAWTNDDVESGFPVAIMLQYGYATGTGGYVQGRDYINPAIAPIFEEIQLTVWRAVNSA